MPFRLTRDIVAPFGVSGVEGLFRKTWEKTMQVLRQNKTMITTILEVLLHDSIYLWAMVERHQDTQNVNGEFDFAIESFKKVNFISILNRKYASFLFVVVF